MSKVPRLTEGFIPNNYALTLRLQREARTFTGTVVISGEKVITDNSITVHAKNLAITKATINGQPAEYSKGSFDGVTLSQPGLAPGSHTVELTFDGIITDAMHGLYPCYYTHDGQKKELLATQFESHHAREVFPCIDEPEAKATFDVMLETETNVEVVGNMPVKSQEVTDSSLITHFETTPRMSTYLLAFVIGELQKVSGKSESGVVSTVWATNAQPVGNLRFALDVATRAIDFFDDYFGVPYPLPKADHVALPDFSAGAMENWGLITYREIALLADETNASLESKQLVARVVAHELSHQWFGNLVTMRWWDDLWLNESFASLMEYVALDALFPEWNYWEHFTASESLPALQRDGVPGVQAIKTSVNHPDEISTLFDPAIVYAKGAKVLRMLREYIGDMAFRDGLRLYFSENAYKNTSGQDLWQAFETVSKKDIRLFMERWIEQPGFPVIHASLTDNQLRLRQARFSIGAHSSQVNSWPIPLSGLQPATRMLFDMAEATITVDKKQSLVLNHNDTAHFIAAYDDEMRQAITKQIKAKTLNSVDRLQILNQSLLLARGDVQPTSDIVKLLPAYEKELSAPVWEMIAAAVEMVEQCIEAGSNAEDGLYALVHKIGLPLYEKVGSTKHSKDSENDILLRKRVIELLVHTQEPTVTAAMLAAFDPQLDTIEGDLRVSVLTAAVQHTKSDEVIKALLHTYEMTYANDIKRDIISALTSTRDHKTIAQIISILTTSAIRAQDVPRWFALLLRNPYARFEAWQWLKTNWQWIEETYAGDKSYDRFPTYAGNALQTQAELDDYKSFFAAIRKQPALSRIIAIGEAEIEGRVKWLARDRATVVATLLATQQP